MNDLSWRARRAAARWLFVERRMELVAEEIPIGGWRADAVGFTRAGAFANKPREVRIVEVKVSRSDLVHGLRKGQLSNDRGLGACADFCHLLVAKGVRIDLGELPDRWGLLTYEETDNGARIITAQRHAKRLAPTITSEDRRLADALTQATLWRHYAHGTELVFKRYEDAGADGEWRRREIAT
jgi:hypothetical protein